MTLSCLEFRQLAAAVPGSDDPAMLAHRSECTACAAFAEEQVALDRRLEAALRIRVPDDLAARVVWSQAGSRPWRPRLPAWQWVAIAASFVLAAVLGVLLPGGTVDRTLPAEIVEHIGHEPDRLVLTPDTRPARPVRVNAVLADAGFSAERPLENVITAGLCPFRGRQVPHLVMRIDGEPVSVLLLAGRPVAAVREFHEGGYHGLLLPHEGGGIAIVAARPELIEPVREQLEEAVRLRL